MILIFSDFKRLLLEPMLVNLVEVVIGLVGAVVGLMGRFVIAFDAVLSRK